MVTENTQTVVLTYLTGGARCTTTQTKLHSL